MFNIDPSFCLNVSDLRPTSRQYRDWPFYYGTSVGDQSCNQCYFTPGQLVLDPNLWNPVCQNHDSSDAVSHGRDKDYTPSEQEQDESDHDTNMVSTDKTPSSEDNTENQIACRIERVCGGRRETIEKNETRKRVRKEKLWQAIVRKEKKERRIIHH
ncbi:hypothetical protein FQR65_LT10032 [Abscondita terminalis]|nr:hypothetical protein FQR65_LT10032 [Abscondita terminalis]